MSTPQNAEKVHPAMREEWAVRHAQGTHPGPFTEEQAREWIADSIKADGRRQPRARGKQRLLRRLVTEWEEVDIRTQCCTCGSGDERFPDAHATLCPQYLALRFPPEQQT